jgi:hypothetical protein
MTHYVRYKSDHAVRWSPDDTQAGYQALADCDHTDADSVSEAKSAAPIEVATGDHNDILSIYNDLVSGSSN